MKISIITPVYNEKKYIDKYLEGIKSINYPKDQYEVVIVDDGSTDTTIEKIKKFIASNPDKNIKLYENKVNQGVLHARNQAANYSQYEYLINIDGHSVIHPDTISNFIRLYNKTKNEVIMGSCPFEKDNINAIFSNMVLRKLYGDQITKSNFDDYYLDINNFEKSLKGTSPLFIKKSLYLKATPKKSSKLISDDIRLLKMIISIKGKFLRTSQASATYLTRDSVIDELRHIFNRGPKFVDYYWKKGTKFFRLLQLLIFLSLITPIIIIGIVYIFGLKILLMLLLVIVLIAFFGPIMILAKNKKEIFVSLLFPVFLFIFIIGIYRGLFYRLNLK